MIWTIDMDDLHAKCNPRSLELSKTIREFFYGELTAEPHDKPETINKGSDIDTWPKKVTNFKIESTST